MSVFKVAINNDKQGLLDTNPATAAQIDPSIQRTIYVAGPNFLMVTHLLTVIIGNNLPILR
jgi:hypothetical protein